MVCVWDTVVCSPKLGMSLWRRGHRGHGLRANEREKLKLEMVISRNSMHTENVCSQGGYCNFMHLKKISGELRKRLFVRNK